jgi:acetyl-CoA synthetase
LSLAGNTIGTFLTKLGLKDEDRICLFIDRMPELYSSFLGILKIGDIIQPLFSAFGFESLSLRLENTQTCAIITQREHLYKVRKTCKYLPFLEFIIVVDYLNIKEPEDKKIFFVLKKL